MPGGAGRLVVPTGTDRARVNGQGGEGEGPGDRATRFDHRSHRWCQIDVDDEELAEVVRQSGLTTKKDAVNEALRDFAAKLRRAAEFHAYIERAQEWDYEGWTELRARGKAPPEVYLVDSSALWRIQRDGTVRVRWRPAIEAGGVGSCGPERIELLRSARNITEFEEMGRDLALNYPDVPVPKSS